MISTPPTAGLIATVLIVEDDPGIAELERIRLEEAGYRVVLATTAEDAASARSGAAASIWCCSTTGCPAAWTGWTSTPAGQGGRLRQGCRSSW